MLSAVVHAQKDVTRFLGIPVDGNKAEMIQKLKEKGFRSTSYDKDILIGEFNGVDVKLFVATNNNRGCRIVVDDLYTTDERSIQIRFNRLCEQFENNPNYLSFQDQAIPDDEDISYEILVHKKRYEAIFYQTNLKEVLSILSAEYTEEQLSAPNDELKELMEKQIAAHCSKKPVWFMISNNGGSYSITMFYDNEYNRAQGEDL